ncbi:MAG: hypothetical protein E7205_10770 [Tissierellaceae bacterium]|mgnify:CR=1 FL=1|jgi:hypothetical protein|nr:hypothetical protein [Tissierellaceae bacterium]
MINNYYLKKLNKKNLKEAFDYDWEDFSIEKILDNNRLKNLGLIYCIIYNYDSVITEYISNADIDYKNIIEARFFNEENEIRVFNDEGKITGTIFKELEVSKSRTDTYFLYPRYGEKNNDKMYANKLVVKKYIDYDDDSQAYIGYVKPSKLIFTGGENNEAN